jgi:hypothetical protein
MLTSTTPCVDLLCQRAGREWLEFLFGGEDGLLGADDACVN